MKLSNMKGHRLFIFGILLLSVFKLHAEPEPVDLFSRANQYYMDEQYEKAAGLYDSLVSIGYASPETYFNLGNAYYKMGNVAAAILNYERARRLKPSDSDIEYNLRMANLNTIDKIEPVPLLFYERWWNEFVNTGTVKGKATWFVIWLWISLGLGACYFFAQKVLFKKLAFYSFLLALLLSLSSWYLTYLQHKHLFLNKGAIIFAESSYVKSSPDDKSANLFLLHSGTRIEVLDELQQWKKIRLANGNEGWIAADALVMI